jgi:hypothetical protein
MADGLLRLLLAAGALALLTQASAPSRRYLPYIPEFIIPGLMALPLVITNFVAGVRAPDQQPQAGRWQGRWRWCSRLLNVIRPAAAGVFTKHAHFCSPSVAVRLLQSVRLVACGLSVARALAPPQLRSHCCSAAAVLVLGAGDACSHGTAEGWLPGAGCR